MNEKQLLNTFRTLKILKIFFKKNYGF